MQMLQDALKPKNVFVRSYVRTRFGKLEYVIAHKRSAPKRG